MERVPEGDPVELDDPRALDDTLADRVAVRDELIVLVGVFVPRAVRVRVDVPVLDRVDVGVIVNGLVPVLVRELEIVCVP